MKNKKYEIKNNVVTVYDKKNQKTERAITSNVEEILIQENKIEEMEKKIKKYTKFLDEQPDDKEAFKKMIKEMLLSIFGVILGNLSFCIFLNYFQLEVSLNVLLLVIVGISLTITQNVNKEYKKYVHFIEEKEETKAALFYLRETLSKEERILYELKGNTQMTSILNASTEKRKVHDKKALKQLKYQLKIWKNLGSEYREYLKNSQNGYLTENQKLDLRIQGIDEELYENYLREQNRLLIMKKF